MSCTQDGPIDHPSSDKTCPRRVVRTYRWPSCVAAVGKSAILLQFTERQFRDAHDMTIGVEFGAKDVTIGDAQVGPLASEVHHSRRNSWVLTESRGLHRL